MVRIAQQNDWVVFTIIGCIFLYIFMFRSLQRDATVKEFLLQQFPDATNNFLSWLIISFVFSLLFATFLSQFIPTVPKAVSDLHFFGFELNRFGFTFFSVLAFYFVRNVFTYIFFAGTGTIKKWQIFYFTAAKFYFFISMLLMILCVAAYFYDLDHHRLLPFYFWGILFILFFKLLYYFFHPNGIMPEKWYYKFLYICTLQIVPILVLWKILFF